MAVCRDGSRLVPLSYFTHTSGWDVASREMTRKPQFCVERQDVNGDGKPDEVGHMIERDCGTSLYQEEFPSLAAENAYNNHSTACWNGEFLPFNLTEDPGDGSVTVFLDPSTQSEARRITLRPGDHVLGSSAQILTYEPKGLLVRRVPGLLVMQEKAGALLDAIPSMGLGQKAYLAGLAAAYLMNPSQERIASGIRYLNGLLKSEERLSNPQVDLMSAIAWKYHDRITRAITDPDKWRAARQSGWGDLYEGRARTEITRYVDILRGSPLRPRERELDPICFLGSRREEMSKSCDCAWWEVRGVVEDLHVTLSARELNEIDAAFSAPKIVVGEAGSAVGKHEPYLSQTVAVLEPFPDSPLVGQFVWANASAINDAVLSQFSCLFRGDINDAVPAIIKGVYKFSQGNLPADEAGAIRNQVATVVLPDGTEFMLSATRLYFPTYEIPAEHVYVPWLLCGTMGDTSCKLQVGNQLEISSQPLGHPASDSVAVTVTQTYWNDIAGGTMIVARDAGGQLYRAEDHISDKLVWEAVDPSDLPPSLPLAIGDEVDIQFGYESGASTKYVKETAWVTDIAWSPYDRGGPFEPFDRGDAYYVRAADAEGQIYEGGKYIYQDIGNANLASHDPMTNLMWSFVDSEDFSCEPLKDEE